MPTPPELTELLPHQIIEAHILAERRRHDQVMAGNRLLRTWHRAKESLPEIGVYAVAAVTVAALAGVTILIIRGAL